VKTLSKSQIHRFITKIHGEDIAVRFIKPKYKEDKFNNFLANISLICETFLITINKNLWKETPIIYQKFLFLHEIGHIYSPYLNVKSGKSTAKDELYAQKWAINTAKKLKMKKLYKYSKNQLNAWKDYDWNGPYRKYRMAHNLAKKEGII